MAAVPESGADAEPRPGSWMTAAAVFDVLAVVAFGLLITAVGLGYYIEPDQIAPLIIATAWLAPAAAALACRQAGLRHAVRAGTRSSAGVRMISAVTLVMFAVGCLLMLSALLVITGGDYGR